MRVSFRLLPVCLTAALFAAAPPADAQETETQRAAAREVVARMAAVQRSLDVPGSWRRSRRPTPRETPSSRAPQP